jgi:histone-lysine N-methyltransferase EZH2
MCDTVKGGKNTGATPEVVILDDDDESDDGNGGVSPRKPTSLETIAAVEAAEEQPEQQQPEQQQPEHNDASSSPWQLWEDAALEKGVEIWGPQPCKIAALVGSRTCFQVRARMMTLLPSPLPATLAGIRRNQNDGSYKNNLNYDLDGNPNRRRRKGGKNATKQPSVVYQRLKRSTEETWPQFHPCGCTGPCNSTCPCHGDANFCEKFCGCDPAWCGNRFQGCQCKCGVNFNKRCSTRQCPCLAAGRECDPDLCKLCIPTLHNTNEPGYQCNNFRIRLRQKRRVLMGLSDVQGWGAFLAGPAVKKDEFLGEYCGELIDQLEADRRGKVYDRDDNSYLFDLNEQWVIDARQKGNKLRFANHSPTANCRAEILMVDGDHRVAILANKDLVPGEELFYDYRYDRRVAPDWAQHSGRGDRGGGEASGSGGRGRGRGR